MSNRTAQRSIPTFTGVKKARAFPHRALKTGGRVRAEWFAYFRIISFTVLPAGIIGSTCSV